MSIQILGQEYNNSNLKKLEIIFYFFGEFDPGSG